MDTNPLLDDEDEDKNDIMCGPSPEEVLMICQACISTNTCKRLTQEVSLAFFKTGVFAAGPPPQVLCVLCVSVMKRWCRFRNESLRTQAQLQNILKDYSKPFEYIKRINNNGQGLIHKLSATDTITLDVDPESKAKEKRPTKKPIKKAQSKKVQSKTDKVQSKGDKVQSKADKVQSKADKVQSKADKEPTKRVTRKRTNSGKVKLETTVKIEPIDRILIPDVESSDNDNDVDNIDNDSDYDDKKSVVVEFDSVPSKVKTDDEDDDPKRLKLNDVSAVNTFERVETSLLVEIPDVKEEDSDDQALISLSTKKKITRKKVTTKTTTKRAPARKRVKKETKPHDPDMPKRIFKPPRTIDGELFDKYFKVTLLSKTEQLAEFEKKKDAPGYVLAHYQCDQCYKGFLDNVAFELHMKIHEETEKGVKCEICRRVYKTQRILRKHRMQHEEKIDCLKCDYQTNSRGAAVLHLKWHEGKVYKCEHCAQTYTRFTTMLSHVRIKHASDFVCPHCGYCFLGEKGLHTHRLKVHPDSPAEVPMDGPICSECDIRFVNQHALDTHHKVSPKHSDTKNINDPSKERKRRKRKDYRLKAKALSSLTAPRKKGRPVREEYEEPEAKILSGSKTYTCDKCGHSVSTMHGYNIHMSRAHPEEARTMNVEKKPILCDICGKRFHNTTLLKDHLNEHYGGGKIYPCDLCPMSFTKRVNLYAHRARHRNRRYSCPLCAMTFTTSGNRDRHYTYVHNGVRDVKCDYCEKLFKTTQERKMHIDHVHLKKPYPKRVRGRRMRGHIAYERDEMSYPVSAYTDSMGSVTE